MDFAVFPTTLGWMAVAGSEVGVYRVVLPRDSRTLATEHLFVKCGRCASRLRETDGAALHSLQVRLARFMDGEAVVFEDTLDTAGWTDFQSRVWQATRRIPYGRTWSYGQVAAAIGQPRACRAVGQALHRNPVPVLVPCHRVVGADSSLTGFGSGLPLKQVLLQLESRAAGSLDPE